MGGHDYRQDIRQAAYRFINMHLKNDPRAVADSEVDLVTGPENKRQYPIPPEKLRVFPQDSDIPKDELNTTIDQHFVPMAKVEPPKQGEYETWRDARSWRNCAASRSGTSPSESRRPRCAGDAHLRAGHPLGPATGSGLSRR